MRWKFLPSLEGRGVEGHGPSLGPAHSRKMEAAWNLQPGTSPPGASANNGIVLITGGRTWGIHQGPSPQGPQPRLSLSALRRVTTQEPAELVSWSAYQG